MKENSLSRRQFLQVMAGSTAAAIVASAGPLTVFAQDGMTYNEAPMLAELVNSGDLPPLSERIPTNPRVVTPRDEVGVYGGTWRRAFKGISDRWGPTKLNEEFAIEWYAPDPDTITLVPNYISEWTQNEDATEFTFILRDGLKWSDGEAFDTEDIQFWYDWFYMGELGSQPGHITLDNTPMELEVVDSLTWTVRFPGPNPLLPTFIAKLNGGPAVGPTMAVPQHYLSQYIPELGDQALIDAALSENGLDAWQQLFGDGGNLEGPIAFWFRNPDLPVINGWMSGNKPTADPYLMVRNPYYHAVDTGGNQLPYIDQINHDLFEDNSVFDLWVAQGRIDMQLRHTQAGNFTLYKENEENGNYRVFIWRDANTKTMFPNISYQDDPGLVELFENPAFREALAISINREEIDALIYDGLSEPRMMSPVTGSPEFDPEFETRWVEYNPDRANQLLDDLGLARGDDGIRRRADGEPVAWRILHNQPIGSNDADMIDLVAGYWAEIGLDVSQDVVERSLYEQRCQNGDVQMGYWSAARNSIVKADPTRYLGTVPDSPWAVLYGNWWLPSAPGAEVEPPADHPIREIWSLWEQTLSEPDEATRNALFQQLLDIHKVAPYMIGVVGEHPALVIVSNNFFNVPDGMIADDTLRHPGIADPVQFFMRE